MCPVLTFDGSTMKDGIDNQSSLYWLDVSSAPDTQSKHSGWETSPRKRLLQWQLVLQHSVCVAPLKT